MISVNELADYLIVKCDEAGSSLSNLKLQKLAYYADAWHLAFYGEKLIDSDFEAWIHGPVNRELYNRFSSEKSLYSDMLLSDCSETFSIDSIADKVEHIDSVLATYGKFSGAQLEEMTHREEPWIQARAGYRPTQRCEIKISNEVVEEYYKSRLKA
ncbi:Panacea domain-containing protein [Vibrio metschnikovii]|uniref:Panacea domain-containing protein n=1 Tax=Vibrio metschnikovii TaxID=28172 RepID=UPI001C30EC70|nr:type II toxin-antitoxin system antitoxin SocA domain-containing protein [Vibrio metschnikovii]